MRFMDRDYAGFYDAQQRDSGYPGALLQPVINALEGFRSVIDIGAGTGFFTIPLLECGHTVTAVEPASGMSDLILKKCPSEKRGMLSIVNTEWENWHGDKHDAAICIHSLYPMREREKAVKLMLASADKRIIIVRDSSEMITLSGMIRKRLGIGNNRDFNSEIRTHLDAFKTQYTVTKISEERDHRIPDIEKEAESVIYQLKIGSQYMEEVLHLIDELSVSDSTGRFFRAIYSDNLYIF